MDSFAAFLLNNKTPLGVLLGLELDTKRAELCARIDFVINISSPTVRDEEISKIQTHLRELDYLIHYRDAQLRCRTKEPLAAMHRDLLAVVYRHVGEGQFENVRIDRTESSTEVALTTPDGRSVSIRFATAAPSSSK